MSGTEIDFIVPAKKNSTRVPNKNWREFADGKSLVDLTIEKLLTAGVSKSRIYVSSDSQEDLDRCENRWCINPLLRSDGLSANNVPLPKWIRTITAQVPGDSDIGWAQVCDPLFNDYEQCLQKWKNVRPLYDSLVVCYPWKGYLMDSGCQPFGWGFGEKHIPSQQLPAFHTMPFTFSLLKRSAIEATGYHVGENPKWHVCQTSHVDIDNEEDFARAQWMHARREECLV